jgi:heptosyltransferase-2
MILSQNILIRGVNWLGDAIMTLPALHRLREAKPDSKLTLLTDEKLSGLWESSHHYDEILTFKKGESPYVVGKRLRNYSFDTALILPNSFRTALECWHGNIPRRIGYAGNWRSFLLTDAIEARTESVPMQKRVKIDIEYRLINQLKPQTFPSSAHHIHRYLHLVKQFGASNIPIAPKLIPKHKGPSYESLRQPRPHIGIISGAEYGPAKCWPVENFTETANRLINNHQAHVLLLGGPSDIKTADIIASKLPPDHTTNLTGKTSLSELVSVLSACDVILCNDSGPMHVAAASGTPVVVPFGSTSPDLTGPGLPGNADLSHQLLRTNAGCSPCFLRECPIDFRCLESIRVDEVVSAIERVLATKN